MIPSRKFAFFMTPVILVIILGAHFLLPDPILAKKLIVPAYVLGFLNIVLLGFTSLTISYLAGISYIRSGNQAILLLGAGALAFGTASVISEWFLYAGGGVNIADTIDHSSALLTGVLYFAATLSVLLDWPRELNAERRRTNLRIGFISIVLFEILIAWGAFATVFPIFFTEGQGPSVLRQMVVGSASGLMFMAGLHILLFYRINRTNFLFWYAFALMIIAEGLLGTILQRSDFGLIGWSGRVAQYLGGVYLLIAAATLVRPRPLEHVLSELLNRPAALYASVFENSMEGIVLVVESGFLLAANPQALAMLGYAPEEVRRLHITDLFSADDPGASQLLRGRATVSRFRGEVMLVRKGGGAFAAEITASTFEDHQGTILQALLFRDVTHHKEAQRALRRAYAENERNLAQLRAIFSQMTVGVVTMTPDGRLQDINQTALSIYGFEDSANLKVHLSEIAEYVDILDLAGNRLSPQQWPIGRALRGETFSAVEVQGRRRDIDKSWMASYSGTPIYDSEGKMLLALVCVRDVTEQKGTEAALRESEARLKSFFKASSVYMAVVELAEDDFVYLMPNRKTAEFFNLSLERMTGMSGRQLGFTDEVVSEGVRMLQQCEQSTEPVTFEYHLTHHDEDYTFLVTVSHIPVKQRDQKPRFAMTAFDITPRIMAEAQTRHSLKEKETLLQEIHHRVKNNMQVIISLLNLQSAAIKDDRVKMLFKESSSRVNAMALIHNYLYQSASLSEIDLSQYFDSLAGSLISMYQASGVTVQVAADDIKLNMDQAIPCGLIINELVSNALKHAFPEKTAGRIRIEARRADDQVVLDITDDGVGIPEDVYHGRTASLGLKLVQGLAENQLGGRMSMARDHGTRFTIEIPIDRQ